MHDGNYMQRGLTRSEDWIAGTQKRKGKKRVSERPLPRSGHLVTMGTPQGRGPHRTTDSAHTYMHAATKLPLVIVPAWTSNYARSTNLVRRLAFAFIIVVFFFSLFSLNIVLDACESDKIRQDLLLCNGS